MEATDHMASLSHSNEFEMDKSFRGAVMKTRKGI